ncbi:MAG: phosphopentomutase [Candidatus Caenarcaniphilales bacterium]|nr:phosphopentomutase [Candidatus Caenarcaniphilales bacterium]
MRVFLVVLDACGVGAMPDWQIYGDPPGANTLANVIEACGGLKLPNLARLGLGEIVSGLDPVSEKIGSFGKAAGLSPGKDTTTGHWEMAGIILDKPFPVYPHGFPQDVIDRFIELTGCAGILANKPASGTEILIELGEEHLKTGYPIVYTSADSVFQIACHIEKVPLERLYRWSEIARELLQGEHQVARVIARPFQGEDRTCFTRLSERRHDYAIEPPGETILSFLQTRGCETVSVGKIKDIFCGRGIDRALAGKSNQDCLFEISDLINQPNSSKSQFIFANLVETDSHFGHRNDPKGFGQALEKIDRVLGTWLNDLREGDLLLLTADHGCDPTLPGTDHTREYIPVLAYSSNLKGSSDLGTLPSFKTVAATSAEWLGFGSFEHNFGQSFLSKL